MVAVALTSVGLTGVLVVRAVGSEVGELARRDLRLSAAGVSEMAATVYIEAGGWSARSIRAMRHVARSRGDEVAVLGADGSPLPGSPAPDGDDGVRAPVVVDGRRVGTIVATAAAGSLAAARLDRRLWARTDDLALEAALLAGVVALLVALVVALRLARPLDRLTDVARRMEAGEIETRAAGTGGGREIAGLARTMDRLAAALRRQDDLRRATAADVSHELRGALVGIVGRIEALQDGTAPDAALVLGRMESDVLRLRRLTGDVERLAEAQRPGLLLHRRPLDLADLARARLDDWADQLRAGSIALERQVRSAPVEGDPERLAQVLDNLFSNAVRYTDPGGRLTVRCGVRRGEAVLEVEDSGIGIAPEHQARVFDRFWRAPGARERAADGSGVGLAVVSELVRAHGGRVELASRPGRGSTFSVLLPLRTGAAAQVAPAAGVPWRTGATVPLAGTVSVAARAAGPAGR